MIRGTGGSAALVVALFLPVLTLVLAGVVAIGLLRTVAERARAAADLAAVIAVNDQSDAELARTGALALAGDATDVARSALAAGLAPLAPFLAGDATSIAGALTVVAVPSGATDPVTGQRAAAPLVRIDGTIPLRSTWSGVLGLPPTIDVRVRSAAAAR